MKYSTAGIVALLVGLAGCERSEPSGSASQPTRSSENTMDATAVAAHADAITAWRTQLEAAQSKIDDLRAHERLATTLPETKAALDKAVKDLDSQARQLEMQMDNFRESGSMTWSTFATDVAAKMTKLQGDVRDATDKYINGAANQPAAPSTPPNPAARPNPGNPPATPPAAPPDPGAQPSPQPQPAPPAPGAPPQQPDNPR